MSRILRDEISLYSINTRHFYEFEKILALIHIDAALDYFLRDNKKQGLNKQYMAFYLWGSRRYNRQADEDYFLREHGYASDFLRDRPYIWYAGPHTYIKILSLTILKNSYYPDSLSRFIMIAELLPKLGFMVGLFNPSNWDLNDFDQFKQFLWNFYVYGSDFGFDFEDYYNSFTIDNFTHNFDLLDFLAKVTFFDGEIEAAIAEYWYEDDETRWFYNPEWDISETLKMLSEDLLYMRDFIEDIRIFGTSIMLEGARRAADAVDTRIPVIEMPISDVTLHAGPTHELSVFATFRQARAEEFFNQYYRVNRALEKRFPHNPKLHAQ